MKKIANWPVLILGLGLILLILTFNKIPDLFNFQSINKSRDLYKTARAYQKSSDYKQAFYTFTKISPSYAAYDAVLFYQAKCAAELGDEKTTILKFNRLLSDFNKSPFAAQASYNLGQAFIRTKNDTEATKRFLDTVKKYPDSNFAIGSYYYLGQIYKNTDKKLSAAYLLTYLEKAPSGRFSTDCYILLNKLNLKLSPKQKKAMAVSLFMNEEFSDAIVYLKQIPLKDSWFYLAESYKEIRNTNLAFYFYKEGLKKSSSANEKKENFQQAMLEYISFNSKPAEKSWDEILSFAGTSRDFALYNKALLLPQNKANKYYWEIITKYPQSTYASDSLWRLFKDAYNNKKDKYKLALKLANIHIHKYKNTKASPAVLFWVGKIYEKLGNTASAKNCYEKIISVYPDNYYAFRADGRINAITAGIDTGWKTKFSGNIPNNSEQIPFPYSSWEISAKYGSGVIELLNVGDYESISSFIQDDPFFESWIDYQNGIVMKSIVTARNEMDKLSDKPSKNDPKWKLVYPIYFNENINLNASLNSLDPLIIMSLIKEESYFNPFALSSSNARGLMQLLPGTAKDIARWKNIGQYSNIELFDPEINIKLGSAYLNHTKNTLSNNMLFAVAAYNGGPAAVERWRKAHVSTDWDEFVENIPYSQTREYVKKVFRSYWNYKRIYNLQ